VRFYDVSIYQSFPALTAKYTHAWNVINYIIFYAATTALYQQIIRRFTVHGASNILK